MDAHTHLAAAAYRLVGSHPYLAAALWAMPRSPCPGLGTLAVDQRWRLYYDPETVLAWSVEELAGVLYHELCHLLRDHAGRAAAFADPRRWNLAADAEINDDLRAEGIALPGAPVYPELFDQPEGRLAEEYYATLSDVSDGGDQAGASGDAGAGECGSSAHGVPDTWEADTAGDQAGENTSDQAGLSAAEAHVVRHRVAQSIREHAAEPGTLPGHWSRWAEERLAPHVDWRRELAAALRAALASAPGAVDYTYTRPSRRQAVYGTVLMPALRQPLPSVAVVVDTSGSIESGQLAQALAEVEAILRAVGGRDGVTLLAVDAVVQSCNRIVRVEGIELAGGGGTDMGVGLIAAARLRPYPDVVVVVTDGYTPWPAQPPRGMRVIVVLCAARPDTQSTPAIPMPPSWARTIRLPQSLQDPGPWHALARRNGPLA